MAAQTGGIDVLKSASGALTFEEQLTDSTGTIITSGGVALRLVEVQNDGTFKQYDFSDNTFKTGALTTATAAMTKRLLDNGVLECGVYEYALTMLTGFTVGAKYLQFVSHASLPRILPRKFQYGGSEGDSMVQTGDSFARIGTSGAGLTAVGDARLANLDATVSSRNATTPPTPAANAAQVRTELTTELGRIDVAVSSRNATTPPTATDNATAVRTSLTTELGRIDAAISSRATQANVTTALTNYDVATAGDVSSLQGAFSRTLRFRDGANAAVPFARFYVVGAGSEIADASGNFAGGFPTMGQYTIVTSPTNGIMFANYTLAEDDEDATISGTAVGLPVSSDPPNLRNITVDLTRFSGFDTEIIADIEVKVELQLIQNVALDFGSVAVGTQTIRPGIVTVGTTDEDGVCVVELVPTTIMVPFKSNVTPKYVFSAATKILKTVTVPTGASCYLEDLPRA